MERHAEREKEEGTQATTQHNNDEYIEIRS